jgi:aspartyl-tRNA synthetase
MARTFVRELSQAIAQEVRLAGFVETLRLQRRMQFVVLRDPTGRVQLVHERGGEGDELEAQLDSLKPESAIAVTGTVRDMPNVKLGGVEVDVREVEVANLAEQPLPIDASSGDEVRAEYRFLDLRLRPDASFVFDVATAFEDGMRGAARRNGFLELHSPKLMAAASEGGAEVFRVDYFGRDAYLAQSPQFYKQMAIAAGMERVFEVGPAFRAEPSFTTRHATEFTSVDLEMAWIDSVEDVMDIEEELLIGGIETVLERYGGAVESTFGVALTVPTRPFPRIPLADAIEAIGREGWTPSVPDKPDLDPDGERRVSRHVKETTGHEFAFVTRYPTSVRPFYHMRPPDDPGSTYSFDLLWNGIEITTGAQREHRYDVLLAQAEDKGVDVRGMEFYLDCFRYGCPPHGGFGLGLARTVMSGLQLPTVRDATFLFRGPNRLRP